MSADTTKKVESNAQQNGGQQSSADQQERPFRKIEDMLHNDGMSCVNTFQGDKMARYRQTAIACGAGCLNFEDLPNGVINLAGYHVHIVEMVAQGTGEIINPTRVVLIDDEGKCYGFVSDFILRELDTIRQVFGDGPYDPPLPLKVSRIRTRKGFNAYSIAPV